MRGHDATCYAISSTSSESFGHRLQARGEVGLGFDWLRVGLALSILFWHSFVLPYGKLLVDDPDAVARLKFL
jgi:hypothetical protein